MMANHSQRKLIPMNLQMFAEGDEPPVVPVGNEPLAGIPPVADDKLPPDGEPPVVDEEFDEILYNKETVKIPKSERKTYLQKGYNYDKVNSRLTEFEQKVAKIQQLTGKGLDEAIQDLEQQILDAEAKQYAQQTGKTEEEAKDYLEKDKRLQAIENELRATKLLTNLEKAKEPFKDKMYFKELESDIDQLIKENVLQNREISVEAAFNYLRGQKLDELMEKAKANTVKSTVADMHDRTRRGVVANDGVAGDDVDTSDINKEMASAFGNSPAAIAKYVKQKLRS